METAILSDGQLNDRGLGCDFCTEASRDCRLLPCLHVFCKNCLEGSQLTVNDTILICPVCGQDYFEKTKTADAFEIPKSSGSFEHSQPQRPHSNLPRHSDDDRDTKTMKRSSCGGGCQQILCVACLASDDLSIKDSMKATRGGGGGAAIEQSASDVVVSKATAMKKLEAIDAEKQEFLSRAEYLKSDVNRTREQLKDIVDRHADSLLSELSAWEEETVRATKVDIDSLCRFVTSLDQHKVRCTEALAKGSPENIGHDDHLFQMPPLKFEGQMNTLHVNLQQTKISDLLIAYNDNIVGILKGQDDYLFLLT